MEYESIVFKINKEIKYRESIKQDAIEKNRNVFKKI